MSIKIFVDGQEGTTGLKIHHYLSGFADVELLAIDPALRKDAAARSRLLNAADIAILCLPDAAARESVALVTNPATRIMNTSTAFRTDPAWAYGLPELHGQRERIASAARVSVPGCHATGFIAALRPLVEAGIVPHDYPVASYAVTGYTGGGKQRIAQYESPAFAAEHQLQAPRHYALLHDHKHIPEMRLYAGLSFDPLFTPVIANYPQGSAVAVPLMSRLLGRNASAKDAHEALAAYYDGEPFIRVMPFDAAAELDEGHFPIMALNDTNRLELFVFGGADRFTVLSRFDNLGKGAAGAAIQNMNLMLGRDERTGLT
ncbi:MAG: N-acetyl-gamma-glutamyl-phosphate reductase [Paenibacillaceae bacterium]|nr:N-acetyl-gamma-glutamyl-phosphate reductase [Paenibacillaceae bacterium]